jgi:hypothetical protein
MQDAYRQIVDAAKALVRDRRNRTAYGPSAPRVAERIWVEPRTVEWSIRVLPKGVSTRNSSALVVDYAQAGIVEVPLMSWPQIRSSYQHWCEGVPWEETEDYANLRKDVERRGSAAGCQTLDDVRRRFAWLDELFASVARGDVLKSRKELHRWNFREHGGIQIGLDGLGRPTLVKGCGFHRLAIAKILNLPRIPAQIGVVDVNAIGLLDRFRQCH